MSRVRREGKHVSFGSVVVHNSPQSVERIDQETETTPALRAVILAAGKDAIDVDGRSILLKRLGDSSILARVVRNALEFVPPEHLYIVVGYRQEDVREHLGAGYNYIVQETATGTGSATLQAAGPLGDFAGNLLILYGDTPLFRPVSLRGLVTGPDLKKAHLEVLTAVLQGSHQYGRIIRRAGGSIIDIIEDTEATQDVREIRE